MEKKEEKTNKQKTRKEKKTCKNTHINFIFNRFDYLDHSPVSAADADEVMLNVVRCQLLRFDRAESFQMPTDFIQFPVNSIR